MRCPDGNGLSDVSTGGEEGALLIEVWGIKIRRGGFVWR
jgi:hypothetical protein